MDKLKKQFFKIRDRFTDQKPLFQRKIDSWKGRKIFLYKQAVLIFNEIEACQKEIVSVFESSDWKYNKAFLKVKIKALDSLIKELYSLTHSSFFKWVQATMIVLAIVFVSRNFVFGMYHVPTSSAEPTLLVGDRVWGNKAIYLFKEPNVGDMVMFQDPEFNDEKDNVFRQFWHRYIGIKIPVLGLSQGPQHMAKRVIACPGDVIEGRVKKGRPLVYRNGKILYESYVNTYQLLALRKYTGFIDRESFGFVKVPKFLRVNKKIVMYSYDPQKDFEEQPFYFIDYRDVLYDKNNGYLKIKKSGVAEEQDTFGPYIVPEENYWVMGDNRRNSIDSRTWGLVPREKISGKASFIIWSLDSEETFWLFELIKHPFSFLSKLRWGRFLKTIE